MKIPPGVAIGVFAVLLYICFRAFMRKMKQTRDLDKAVTQAQGEIAQRLQAVAAALGGTFVEGPALQTSKGKLALMATRAPQVPEVDVTKFTAALQSPGAVTVMPIEDAAKAIQTKSLHPVEGLDAAVAGSFKVLASDPEFGRRIAVVELTDRLRALDKVAGGRVRLQIAPHGATLLVEKGLSRPEDLQAFHDGAAGVVDAFRKLCL